MNTLILGAMFLSLLVFKSIFSNTINTNSEDEVENFVNFDDPYGLDISKSPQCKSDFDRLCGKYGLKNNFHAIVCMQSNFQENDLSEDCEHLLWTYKVNLTTNANYEQAAKGLCMPLIEKLPECSRLKAGQMIPCIVEQIGIDNSTIKYGSKLCLKFLNRLTPVIFSDYRITYRFQESCAADIERLKCGRMETYDKNKEELEVGLAHSQGRVLLCMEQHIADLEPLCKHQLLRIAELQGSDYHYDRPLYYACRDDREKMCADVESGEGRVYHCLYAHKFYKEMSKECRDILTTHQRIEQEDYKVKAQFTDACQDDILKYHCLRHIDRIAGFQHARMSAIILCLENAMYESNPIKAECYREIKEVRRELMEDFQINPDLVADCGSEIQNYCGGPFLEVAGKTIHCLLALTKVKKVDKKAVILISKRCEAALETVMMEANVAEDIGVDPYLRKLCQPVIDAYCSNVHPGEGRMYQCLLNAHDFPLMVEGCKVAIEEMHHFIGRNYQLDPELYQACHKDAVSICKASPNWYQLTNGGRSISGPGDSMGLLVMSCLFNHIEGIENDPEYKAVSNKCGEEVIRVIRARGVMNELDPNIELECLTDLTEFCLQRDHIDQSDVTCLENNLQKLTAGCKKAVSEYIVDVQYLPEIHRFFVLECKSFWQKHCSFMHPEDIPTEKDEGIEQDKGGMRLMKCLVRNKNHPNMPENCKLTIDHYQIATLEDVTLSPEFKRYCSTDANKICSLETKKAAIVSCLSESVLNDTYASKSIRVSPNCRKELNYELFQRSEDIQLDPILEAACKGDVERYCSKVKHGDAAVVECLKTFQHKLSPKCHQLIFKREEIEAYDSKNDYLIYSKCKNMILKYCSKHLDTPGALLTCLAQYIDEDRFEPKCRQAVISRERVQALDIRLDPEMDKACRLDAAKFCEQELKERREDMDAESIIIQCLRLVLVKGDKNKKGKLSPSCASHIEEEMVKAAKDFKMNPGIMINCLIVIEAECIRQLESAGKDVDNGAIEECLFDLVDRKVIGPNKEEKCFVQVKRLLEESHFQIKADPDLYKSCINDLKLHCSDVPKGEGREVECLYNIAKAGKVKLTSQCLDILVSRVNMWARFIDSPMSLSEISNVISNSPARNYLMGMFVLIVCVIFLVGLLFGRITKRLRRELKDR